MNSDKVISLIVPVYNESAYIKKFIESIINQDYDSKKVEIIFIDGNSTDNTKKIIENEMNKKNIEYCILENEKKITPISLNMGIKNAKGKIIIRLDAHSEYPQNYISKCAYYINNIDADNVGCCIETVSEGIIGNAIAEVLSSKFGVGNSKFRTNSKSGYVDTVPFGTFRRELFEKIGYFNEKLVRNQDAEFNSRIIKSGGKIYLFDDIKLIYHPRDTIKKLIKMAYTNGKWNLYTNYLVPGSMRMRHFIPLLFALSTIIGILLVFTNYTILKLGFLLEMILYLLLDLIFSFKNIKRIGIFSSILCLIIYPLFHLSYGIGTISGISLILKDKIKKEETKK